MSLNSSTPVINGSLPLNGTAANISAFVIISNSTNSTNSTNLTNITNSTDLTNSTNTTLTTTLSISSTTPVSTTVTTSTTTTRTTTTNSPPTPPVNAPVAPRPPTRGNVQPNRNVIVPIENTAGNSDNLAITSANAQDTASASTATAASSTVLAAQITEGAQPTSSTAGNAQLANDSRAGSASIGGAGIAGIFLGGVLLLAVIAIFIIRKRNANTKDDPEMQENDDQSTVQERFAKYFDPGNPTARRPSEGLSSFSSIQPGLFAKDPNAGNLNLMMAPESPTEIPELTFKPQALRDEIALSPTTPITPSTRHKSHVESFFKRHESIISDEVSFLREGSIDMPLRSHPGLNEDTEIYSTIPSFIAGYENYRISQPAPVHTLRERSMATTASTSNFIPSFYFDGNVFETIPPNMVIPPPGFMNVVPDLPSSPLRDEEFSWPGTLSISSPSTLGPITPVGTTFAVILDDKESASSPREGNFNQKFLANRKSIHFSPFATERIIPSQEYEGGWSSARQSIATTNTDLSEYEEPDFHLVN